MRGKRGAGGVAQPCARRRLPPTEGFHVKRNLAGLVKRGLRHAVGDRSHPIEKLVLRSAGLTRHPSDGQLDEIAGAISRQIEPLLGAALAGNVHALRKVTDLAAALCAETTTLACLHHDAADTVARERTSWPLNFPRDARERRRALRLVTGPRRLPLCNPPLEPVVARKTGGFTDPANAAVLVALKAIEIERSFRIPAELFPTLQPGWSAAAARLPDLAPASAEAWFRVIWLYVCERHAGAPERSVLRRLVAPERPSEPPAPDTELRAALRLVLAEAFFRLAKGRERKRRAVR